MRQDRQQFDKRLGAVEKQITNIIDAIADGVATASMKARLLELETEKERLVEDLAALGQANNVVELHPGTAEAYRRRITELEEALAAGGEQRRAAAAEIRAMITSIDVVPLEGRGKFELKVNGVLSELLNLPNRKPGEPLNTVMVVAEARYGRIPQREAAPRFVAKGFISRHHRPRAE